MTNVWGWKRRRANRIDVTKLITFSTSPSYLRPTRPFLSRFLSQSRLCFSISSILLPVVHGCLPLDHNLVCPLYVLPGHFWNPPTVSRSRISINRRNRWSINLHGYYITGGVKVELAREIDYRFSIYFGPLFFQFNFTPIVFVFVNWFCLEVSSVVIVRALCFFANEAHQIGNDEMDCRYCIEHSSVWNENFI